MAIVVPDEGKVRMLEWLLDGGTPGNLIVTLYTNNYSPVAGSVYVNFTVPTDEGLAHTHTLTNGSWTVGATGIATYDVQQSWTLTGSSYIVYGYIVWDDTDDTVMWAEEFAASETTYNGKVIKITPAITMTTA